MNQTVHFERIEIFHYIVFYLNTNQKKLGGNIEWNSEHTVLSGSIKYNNELFSCVSQAASKNSQRNVKIEAGARHTRRIAVVAVGACVAVLSVTYYDLPYTYYNEIKKYKRLFKIQVN